MCDAQIVTVADSWKTGKDFRHIVLKQWLRSSETESEPKVYVHIARVKKNLQWYDKSDVGVVVNAHELYNEFVKYKLAKKSVSKLIIAQRLYITIQ